MTEYSYQDQPPLGPIVKFEFNLGDPDQWGDYRIYSNSKSMYGVLDEIKTKVEKVIRSYNKGVEITQEFFKFAEELNDILWPLMKSIEEFH